MPPVPDLTGGLRIATGEHCDRRPAIDRIRRYVFTKARIDCKAWQHRLRRPVPWSLAGLTAGPGSELNSALAPYHPAEQARGTR